MDQLLIIEPNTGEVGHFDVYLRDIVSAAADLGYAVTVAVTDRYPARARTDVTTIVVEHRRSFKGGSTLLARFKSGVSSYAIQLRMCWVASRNAPRTKYAAVLFPSLQAPPFLFALLACLARGVRADAIFAVVHRVRQHPALPGQAGVAQAVNWLLGRCWIASLINPRVRLITHGESNCRELRRLCPGRWLERLIDMPYPVGQCRAWSKRGTERAAFGIPEGCFALLMFGSLRRNKNYDLVMRAIRGIERAVLVIVGLPTNMPAQELCDMAKQFGVAERVIVIPHDQPGTHLCELHAAVDCGVMPYGPEFTGTSGPLLQALSHGVPVIAAQVGDLGRLVERAGVGWTFPAFDVEALAACIDTAISEQGTALASDRANKAIATSLTHDPKSFVRRMFAAIPTASN